MKHKLTATKGKETIHIEGEERFYLIFWLKGKYKLLKRHRML